MYNKKYKNFVKATSQSCSASNERLILCGEEARKLYLEEVKDAGSSRTRTSKLHTLETRRKIQRQEEIMLTNKDLFVIIQNNDVDRLKHVLDICPDKINIVDDFGWSLLMIACQANAIESAKELLKRGIDMSIRDKADNSARSLVIKNKNYALADLLLNYGKTESIVVSKQELTKRGSTSEFVCDVCNKTFPDREEHLSSTIHNISASKGKKIPVSYAIPASNKGYQLMLKGGWDRDSGLGRDGSGKKYPIKTVQKKDRKGLGHEKRKKEDVSNDCIKDQRRKMFADNCRKHRQFEINFRREFY